MSLTISSPRRRRRWAGAARRLRGGRGAPAAVAATVGILFALTTAGAGGGADLGTTAAMTSVDAGYRDFSYGTGVAGPTTKEVQSKLWFNDGSWWGVLFTPAGGKFQIYRLDTASQTWTNTNTTVDSRGTVRNDVLWDGTHLYVGSAGTNETTATHAPKVRRFSYSSTTRTYTLDKGFPVSVDAGGGMQAFVIDKDSSGTLWATYSRQSKIWFTHTSGGDGTWVAPVVVPSPGATTIKAEDESGVVAFNRKIGIMWGNQNEGAYYWAVHDDGTPDTAWQVSTADRAPEEADNHINLKALDNDPAGQVFAAVKTSLNAPVAPLYKLLVLGNDSVWRQYVYGRVMDNHTRGTVVIDRENRRIYMAAASPCCSGGTIYYKVSSLDNISFPVGIGTPLMKSATDTHINNVTSTKQPVSSATGLAMIAGDDTSRFYLHNQLELGTGDNTPPDTTIASGPSGTTYTSSATFEFSSNEAGATFACSLDGGAFSSCTTPHTYAGLADGQHSFQVRAIDLSGNTDSTPASRTWTADTSNLTIVISPNADAEVDAATPDTNVGTRSSIVVDASPSSDGYVRFPVNVTGTILDARLRLFATDGTLDGPAAYTAGSTWSETGITWNNRPGRSGAALDDRASIAANSWMEYNVTSAVTANGTYTFDLVPTSDDAVVWSSREAASNRPELVLTVEPDTTPPHTSIDLGPGDLTASAAATFTFSADETGSTFECSLDAAAFVPCASPKSYTALAEGAHAFQVRARDAAGNVDPTPASRGWTVDTVAPEAPVITNPADGSATSASPTIFGRAEAAAVVRIFDGTSSLGSVTVDGAGAWSKGLSGLVGGSHTLAAKATDAAGNVSDMSAAVAITVDTIPPQTSIDSGATGVMASSSASFGFSADDAGSTFECSLDASAFAPCTSPKAYTGLADGAHTFQVRATDAVGNVDGTPASRAWTVDTVAPPVDSVAPTDGSLGVPTSSNVTATFSESMDPSSIDGATFTLVVSGLGTAVSASVSYDAATQTATLYPVVSLAPATEYTATIAGGSDGVADLAGNTLAAGYTWSFTTDVAPDTTPPDTSIDAGPSGPTGSATASFTFSSSEGSSRFACSLDGAPFSSCTSPKAYDPLSQGEHDFAVRATDGAGNTDPTPASRTWTVDTVAPTAPVISSPADKTSTTASSLTVSGTAETGASVTLRDGGTQIASTTAEAGRSWEVALTSVADGSHTYSATATDAAGNTSSASTAVHVTVDTAAPETTVDSGPAGPTPSASATFALSSSETGSTFECSLDGGAFTGCSSPKAYTGLGEGGHVFRVRATDAAGNVDPTPASRSWTVDTVAPAAPSITSPSDGSTWTSRTLTVSGRAEVGATVELFDRTSSFGTASADASGSWSKPVSGLADGQHTFTATARDAAGNSSPASTAVGVTVDATVPETTIDSGPSGTTTSTSATFSFSSSDPGATFACSLDGAAFSACTSPKSYSGLGDGAHSFQVRAAALSGNTDPTPATRSWTVSFSVFSDGFESGNFSAWTVLTGGDGAATVQSTVVKTGSFAAQLSETANLDSFAYARRPLGGLAEVTVKGDFQILTEGASGGNVPIFRLFDAAGNRIVSLYRQNASGDKVQLSYGGSIFVTTGRLPLNTWGDIELHVIVAGVGTSTVEAKVNGSVVHQSSTANLGTAPVTTLQIGNETKRQIFTLVADNVTVRVPPAP